MFRLKKIDSTEESGAHLRRRKVIVLHLSKISLLWIKFPVDPPQSNKTQANSFSIPTRERIYDLLL